MQAFFDGVRAYTTSFRVISEMRLWGYMLIPALISILVAVAIGASAYGLADNLGGILAGWYPFERGAALVSGAFNIIAGLLIAVLGLILYKHLVMVLSAPFMTPLASKIEDKIRGVPVKEHGFSPQQMIKDLFRSLHIALRNITRELFYVLLLLLLNFVPGIGSILSTAGIFTVQAFYAGFGNMDFLLERHYSVPERIAFVNHHRGLIIGNGAVYLLLLMSGIGFLFASPLATVAATIEGVKRIDTGSIPQLANDSFNSDYN